MYYEAAVGVCIMATAQCSFSCLIVSIWQAEALSFHVRPYNKRMLSHCYGAFFCFFFYDHSACTSLRNSGDLGVGSCFCCKGEMTLNRKLVGYYLLVLLLGLT